MWNKLATYHDLEAQVRWAEQKGYRELAALKSLNLSDQHSLIAESLNEYFHADMETLRSVAASLIKESARLLRVNMPFFKVELDCRKASIVLEDGNVFATVELELGEVVTSNGEELRFVLTTGQTTDGAGHRAPEVVSEPLEAKLMGLGYKTSYEHDGTYHLDQWCLFGRKS